MESNASPRAVPHVVIVGGGFGGLTAARALARAPVRVTLIDRRNHHLFQPLLYQVATAGLSPAEIAYPIRSVLASQRNATVLLDELTGIDLATRTLSLRDEAPRTYDFLVLALGAQNHYFGHAEWERHAPGLKSIEDAIEIRRRVLLAFEAAEREPDPARRVRLLTFVVIGGGPTGVEMAGALAELARFVLAKDFRTIDPAQTRVVLLEGTDTVLSSFDPPLPDKAVAQLRGLGVEVLTGKRVTAIDETGVALGNEHIASATVVWGAGVGPSPFGRLLGAPLDRAGRVRVESDCSLPGHPEVFAIGDMASFEHTPDGKPLPGVSPVAMQQARALARNITRTLRGEAREPFRYRDKGTMATIGRSRAVAQAKGLRLSGLLAWLAWLFVHVWYLIGFRNRVVVMFTWAWSYLTYGRGARLITAEWRADHPATTLPSASVRENSLPPREAPRPDVAPGP